LENVGTRRVSFGQKETSAIHFHRELVLGAGERKPDAVRATDLGEGVATAGEGRDFVLVERSVRGSLGCRRSAADHQRPSALSPERVEKREVVPLRDSEVSGYQLANAPLGQQVREKRVSRVRLRVTALQGQRTRNRERFAVGL